MIRERPYRSPNSYWNPEKKELEDAGPSPVVTIALLTSTLCMGTELFRKFLEVDIGLIDKFTAFFQWNVCHQLSECQRLE